MRIVNFTVKPRSLCVPIRFDYRAIKFDMLTRGGGARFKKVILFESVILCLNNAKLVGLEWVWGLL